MLDDSTSEFSQNTHTHTWLFLLLASFERSFFSRSWMRASLEPWMSSSVEREEEGRGATDFFKIGLGRL